MRECNPCPGNTACGSRVPGQPRRRVRRASASRRTSPWSYRFVVREAPVQARIAVRRFRGSNPGETALIALGIEEHDLERDSMLEIEECHPNYPNYVEVASCRRWRGFQLIEIDPRHESPFTRPSRYLLPFLVQGPVCLKRHARGNIVGVIQAAETGAASSPVLASATSSACRPRPCALMSASSSPTFAPRMSLLSRFQRRWH